MIVLDTDVASALIRGDQNEQVVGWINSLESNEIYLTTTTVSEMIFGLMRMPEGRRKNQLDDDIAELLSAFSDRLLEFDFVAAFLYGRFVPDRYAIGRPIERDDAQIAACCLANDATLATRNTRHFEEIPGLNVVNPWERV